MKEQFTQRLIEFGVIFSHLKSELFESIRPHGITPLQQEILFYCHFNCGTTISEMSRCLGLAVPNCSRELKKLEKEMLLERRPTKEDRRIKGVYLTEGGGVLLHSLSIQLNVEIEKRFTSLSSQDILEATEAMKRLAPLLSFS